MQEQTPIPKKRPPVKKTAAQKPKPKPKAYKKTARSMKTMSSNPYANVPVKTNNMIANKSSNVVPRTGFGFPGTIPS